YPMRTPKKHRRRLWIGVAILVLLLVVLHGGTFKQSEKTIFTVSRTAGMFDIRDKLLQAESMQGRWLFDIPLWLHGGYWRIQPGGYVIDPSMTSWQIAGILTSPPALKWVVIPEGFRKEQVALRLQRDLGWDDAKREAFLHVATDTPYDLTDGFYFPDTYLIPADEDVVAVTKRFINRFNDNFAPYVTSLRDANIKYDKAIKMASIIQREAGGQADMPVIAGVLWNRLLINMPLEIDATLQYLRGDTGSGSWAPIDIAVKKIDSPYNTYMYKGLPPSPISNPGLDAIEAVLHPADTKCLFYLHDNNRQIHCSETYEGHLENIEKYLRNPK
ncbi:MAG TPA: endolytic transglycosylase MltG, partial [Candidatus Peribacteria bacterium]|nr:endolytic transglycosylase MltG [Candidatus Peribacteria bacterium]